MSKPIVISLGEILWDMLPTGKRAGGAPVNFAYHASQNGAESFAISAVGNDELGTELLSDAHKAGINTLVQTNEYPTGTVDVALTNGIPEYTIVENVAWDHIKLTDELVEAVSKAEHLGSALPRIPRHHRRTAQAHQGRRSEVLRHQPACELLLQRTHRRTARLCEHLQDQRRRADHDARHVLHS